MYNVNEQFFNKINNSLNAYWLGFLMADGCILEYHNKKTHKLKAMALQLTLSQSDVQHVELFKHDIESEAPITINKIKGKNKNYYSSKIVICNTNICRDLIQLNCVPRKSLIVKYPINKIPYEYERDFIRGYFDGDGCINCSISKDKRGYNIVSLTASFLGTDDMMCNIQKILSNNGIISYFHQYDKRIPELRLHGRENIKNLFMFLYHDINNIRFLQRKYDKFLYIFNQLDIGV